MEMYSHWMGLEWTAWRLDRKATEYSFGEWCLGRDGNVFECFLGTVSIAISFWPDWIRSLNAGDFIISLSAM